MTELSDKSLHITHNGTVSQIRTVNTKFLCVYELKEKDLAFGRSNIIGRMIARPCIFNSYTYKILVSTLTSLLNPLYLRQRLLVAVILKWKCPCSVFMHSLLSVFHYFYTPTDHFSIIYRDVNDLLAF